jgi:hypothetical protein
MAEDGWQHDPSSSWEDAGSVSRAEPPQHDPVVADGNWCVSIDDTGGISIVSVRNGRGICGDNSSGGKIGASPFQTIGSGDLILGLSSGPPMPMNSKRGVSNACGVIIASYGEETICICRGMLCLVDGVLQQLVMRCGVLNVL